MVTEPNDEQMLGLLAALLQHDDMPTALRRIAIALGCEEVVVHERLRAAGADLPPSSAQPADAPPPCLVPSHDANEALLTPSEQGEASSYARPRRRKHSHAVPPVRRSNP